jgi:hypothetical protein
MGEDRTEETGKCNDEKDDADDETDDDRENDIMAIMTRIIVMTNYVLNPVEN